MQSLNRRYLPAVDHLRGFAALLVLYYHAFEQIRGKFSDLTNSTPEGWPIATNWFIAPIIEGHTAVALFLVISGFILTYGSIDKQFASRQFFVNRGLRIFPLYLFVLLIGTCLSRNNFTLLGFLQRVLPLGNYPGGIDVAPWADVTWSIAIEMQLYLLFPVVHWYLNLNRVWPLLRLMVLVMVCRFAGLMLNTNLADLYSTILGRVDQFLLGALLAYWLKRNDPKILLRWLFPVSISAAFALLYWFNSAGGNMALRPWRIAWPLLEGLMWAFVLACYLQVAEFLPKFISKIWEFFGETSYSIYLVHLPILLILTRKAWLINIPAWGGIASVLATITFLYLPVVVVVAWMTFHTIEKPFLDLRKRYVGRPLGERHDVPEMAATSRG